MARAPLRIGIAGCGNVLGAYLTAIERLQHDGWAEAVAIAGLPRHRERAAATGIPSFHDDYRDMLRREDVDIVVVLTPMPEHARMAREALDAGKHVVLEKPLGVNLEEGRQLLAAAQASSASFVCAPFTTLSPTFNTILDRLRRGDIGKVTAARGRYGWAGPDWADWFYKPGGGALFDLGVYNIATLTGWLGPVRRVSAMSGVAVSERLINGQTVRPQTDDNVNLLLDFGDACFASVLCGFTIQQYRGPAIELYGTEGTINLLGDDWDPDGYEIWQNAAGCWQLFKETQPEWPWTDGLRHLVQCLREGTEPQVTPEHAFHVLEVMLCAQDAARDGQTRAVESTFAPPRASALTPAVAAHRVHDRTRTE
jgi:predicted dehydrogenase